MTHIKALEAAGFLTLDGPEIGRLRLEYRWIPPAAEGRPPLVFLHEGLGCVALWKDFPDKVAAATGCGVLVYSRAGYGASDPVAVPRPLTYMQHEGMLVLPRLLEALDLNDAVLVGHSDGGSIALVAAATGAAPRLRGVVSMAAHAFNETLTVVSIAKAREAYLHGDLRARLARLHGDNVDCAFWGWNTAWLDPGFLAWSIEPFLPRIRLPVLVIQGEDDEYGTGAQVEAIANGCGGDSEVLMLPACGHSPHRDQPQATLEAIAGFVARLFPHAGSR